MNFKFTAAVEHRFYFRDGSRSDKISAALLCCNCKSSPINLFLSFLLLVRHSSSASTAINALEYSAITECSKSEIPSSDSRVRFSMWVQ